MTALKLVCYEKSSLHFNGVIATLVLTVVCCGLYPLVVCGIARILPG